jgi:hypothetical protein
MTRCFFGFSCKGFFLGFFWGKKGGDLTCWTPWQQQLEQWGGGGSSLAKMAVGRWRSG